MDQCLSVVRARTSCDVTSQALARAAVRKCAVPVCGAGLPWARPKGDPPRLCGGCDDENLAGP